jgi:hypothetical protein
LERVGSLEQAAKEAQAVLDKQNESVAKAKEAHNKVLDETVKANECHHKSHEAVVKKCAELEVVAKATLAKAEDEAKVIVNSAKDYLKKEQEAAELRAKEADEKAVTAEAKLADVETRIAKAQATLRKLAGVE